MLSDIEIARKATMQPITELAQERLGIPVEALEPHGHYKAKVALAHLEKLQDRTDGQLVLVTAISPTPAGEGKTTTTVGLGDAMNRIGRKTMICLREPSLGPCFGVKGGAAGGGYAQVVPMEDINLHFTGDLHAISSAHNLLSALVDNHLHQGNPLALDARRLTWRRVVDMNDRALRKLVVGLGGAANGIPREDGYDITVASEVMAIFCLATSMADLRERLANIVIGYTRGERKPVYARDLNAHGAMTVLLKDAIQPNLVQTLEHCPAFVHGGPFANIAHGCNSVIATQAALKLTDIVITEAGFGADLGAEKFINIKCRMAGLKPAAAVLVATVRALKYHGGVEKKQLGEENLEALDRGIVNLERHLRNIENVYGLPCIICINHFTQDTDAEIELLQKRVRELGGNAVLSRHWAEGGAGAEDLARAVAAVLDKGSAEHRYAYGKDIPLWEKIEEICTKVYAAAEVRADAGVRARIEELNRDYGHFPVCIAKTQMSFSTDPTLRGAPTDHVVEIREVRLAHGAGFIVAIAGNMMTMPGLPRTPAAESIDVDPQGNVTGLF